MLFCLAPLQQAFAGNQLGILAGVDRPQPDADHASSSGLLRFQLQTTPKTFRLQTAFSAAVGSSLMTGEFSVGPTFYILSKLLEDSRIQPFIGAEGIGIIGTRDEKTLMSGGYGIFTGADLKVFSKKSGLTLMLEVTNVGQNSVRFWLGFFHFNI